MARKRRRPSLDSLPRSNHKASQATRFDRSEAAIAAAPMMSKLGVNLQVAEIVTLGSSDDSRIANQLTAAPGVSVPSTISAISSPSFSRQASGASLGRPASSFLSIIIHSPYSLRTMQNVVQGQFISCSRFDEARYSRRWLSCPFQRRVPLRRSTPHTAARLTHAEARLIDASILVTLPLRHILLCRMGLAV